MLFREANHDRIKAMVCCVCGDYGVDVHHWRTRGAGGDDELSNLVPLCRTHHDEFHSQGRTTFWTKYKSRITTYRMIYGLPPLDETTETF